MDNCNYAKIIDGKIVYATEPIKKKGYEIINPKEQDFFDEGYMAVVKTPKPEKEGYYFTKSVKAVNGVPTEVWTAHEVANEEN